MSAWQNSVAAEGADIVGEVVVAVHCMWDIAAAAAAVAADKTRISVD